MFDVGIYSDMIYPRENNFAPGRFSPCPGQDLRYFFFTGEFAGAGYAEGPRRGCFIDIWYVSLDYFEMMVIHMLDHK